MTTASPLAQWGARVADPAPARSVAATPLRSWASRNWLALSALALMIANDYKFRTRSPTETLSGGVDLFILLEIGIYGVVAAYLLLAQPRLPRLRRPPVALFLTAAYVALLVVSVTYSPFRSLAAVRALETLVLFGLVASACSRGTRADMHRLAHGFLALVAGSVALGVLFPQPPVSANQEGRFTWLQVHPITAGVFLGIATLIALTYLLARHRPRPGPAWPAWVYGALLVVVVGGLLATRTRNAVLGSVIGLVVVFFCLYRGRRLVTVLLGSAVAASAALLLAGELVVLYFVRGESAERLASLNSRTSLWSHAYEAIGDQPLFGYGLSASRGLFLEETGLGGGHNAVLNVAVDLGLLGLLLWSSLLVVLVRAVMRVGASAAAGVDVDRALVLGLLALLVVGGIFFEGLGAVANIAANWFFLLVAWAVVLDRSTRRAGGGRRSWPLLRRPADARRGR